jgi:hypothetical protein
MGHRISVANCTISRPLAVQVASMARVAGANISCAARLDR